jgi:hypothetical protein
MKLSHCLKTHPFAPGKGRNMDGAIGDHPPSIFRSGKILESCSLANKSLNVPSMQWRPTIGGHIAGAVADPPNK